jgi:hypothetical protein
MKGAARFLFGAALGVALGYALMLLVRPPAPLRKSRRPEPDPSADRDGEPVS